MSMSQDEQAKAAKIAAAVDKFIVVKEEIREILDEAGVDTPETTPFAAYPSKVEELALMAQPATAECSVNVTLNPTGAAYWLPATAEERTLMLQDAKAHIHIDGDADPYTTPVTALENFTAHLKVHVTHRTAAQVWVTFGAQYAIVLKSTVAIAPATTVNTSVLSIQNPATTRLAFGRAQIFTGAANNPITTYPIARYYNADGTYTEHCGYFDDDNGGVFVSQTGIKLSLWNQATAESAANELVIDDGGGSSSVNLLDAMRCFREAEPLNVTASNVVQKMAYFPKCYTKRERATLSVPRRANGSVVSTESLDCIILWVSDYLIDNTWHLHGAFIETRRGEEDVELEGICISRYKVNSSYNSVSGADGVGTTRANYCTNIKNKNSSAMTWTDRFGVYHSLAAGASNRRWAMIGYREECLLQLYGYLWFGVDSQNGLSGSNGLRGICTTASPDPGQPKSGYADHLVTGGKKIGAALSPAGITAAQSAGSDLDNIACNNDVRGITLFLNIENPFSAQEGTMMGDVSRVCYRDSNNAAVSTLLIALDRSDYNPGSSDFDGLLAAGYHELRTTYTTTTDPETGVESFDVAPVYLADMNRQANLTAAVERDMFFPTSTKANENITVGGVDTYYENSGVPASGDYTTKNWRMVALGNYRASGAALGAFYLSAAHDLGFSDGGHDWRGRSTCHLVA